MAAPDVVLYYSHVDSPAVRREVATLRSQLDVRYDIIVVGYCRSPDALDGINGVPTRAYVESELRALPYPGKLALFKPNDQRGNCDLVPMRFFQDQPDYERYWIIENDVRFGGDWSTLFAELAASDADLLATTTQTHSDNPDWSLWHTLATGGEEIPLEHRVKGFIPFGRVSRRLFQACDARYREGWRGHTEVLWPTIAIKAGLRVEDIGGNGPFTPSERRGRHYYNTPHHWSLFPGTFVFRPAFSDRYLAGPKSQFPGWLWHPVRG